MCDRYNKFGIDHLKIILCIIQWMLSNLNSSNLNTSNPNNENDCSIRVLCQSVCSIRVVCIQSMAH